MGQSIRVGLKYLHDLSQDFFFCFLSGGKRGGDGLELFLLYFISIPHDSISNMAQMRDPSTANPHHILNTGGMCSCVCVCVFVSGTSLFKQLKISCLRIHVVFNMLFDSAFPK